LGVSVAAANMMGLDLERTRMAMGLAASQGSGVRKNVGSMGKAFHHGHGTRCGVFAALLAERGYKVDPDIIEGEDVGKGHGRFGLADTFCGIGNYRLDRMIDDLGRDWELDHDRTVVRLHPTSTPAQSPIDTMLDLARQHLLTADQVDKIELDVTRECMTIACYPDAPNSHRAKFCLRYMMAVSLIDKRAGIAQFTDDRVKRQDVQSLMDKVTVAVPADLERHAGTWGENGVSWGENRLRVTLKGHKVLSTARSHARGYPQEPATWGDLAEKFAECADGVLSKSRVDDVTAMVVDLDRLGSTADLMAALRVSD
jgi:2-methylcitrate dehydratase PrpD